MHIMQERSLNRILPPDAVIDDGDMKLFRALPRQQHPAVGPFVFVDHYRHQSRRGIGDQPHPHAGIEVISYLLEGGLEHRDSMGFRDHLQAGDAQHIVAGRGILHAEQPDGGRHGLQLWISLPRELKHAKPAYQSFRASEIPHTKVNGADLFVIAGTVNGVQGPMVLTSKGLFARLRLPAYVTITLQVNAALQLGLYVLEGGIKQSDQHLEPGALGLLGLGDSITLTAGAEASEVALLGGEVLRDDILFAGPFVMDTPERLAQAKRDYANGSMGRLDGIPF
jgi:redox-sensitive bicupin YhaK (pirin superfamily)